MKKTVFFTLALVLILFAFAGCGKAADTATFSLIGFTGHDDHFHYSQLIENTEIELKEGANAFDVISEGLAAGGYSFEDETYIYMVTASDGTAYAAGDLGENSGWMFVVNGVIPSVSMSDCAVEPGDSVELRFISDFNTEVDWSTGTFIDGSDQH